MKKKVPVDTVSVTAPVTEIANAYALASERGVSLSDLTIEAWGLLIESQADYSRGVSVAEGHKAREEREEQAARSALKLAAASNSLKKMSATRAEAEHEFRSQLFGGIKLADIELSDYAAKPAEHTARKVLWGQFARFLPVKYTLRILASFPEHPVSLVDWQDAVRRHSFLMREHLRDKDLRNRIPRGAQLSAGFPRGNTSKKTRSMERFLSHYTAVIQSSGAGPVVGMCAELGFITVDTASKQVSLTPEGLQYVLLPNPQLDGDHTSISSTTIEERRFLMLHISSYLSEDWQFCQDVLSAIHEGWNTSDLLFNAMSEKYSEPTPNTLRTNLGGALGRLGDLGMVSRSWIGRNSQFQVVADLEAAV